MPVKLCRARPYAPRTLDATAAARDDEETEKRRFVNGAEEDSRPKKKKPPGEGRGKAEKASAAGLRLKDAAASDAAS